MTSFIIEKLEDGKYKHCLSVSGNTYASLETIWNSNKSWFLHGDFRIYKLGEFEKAEYFSK